MNGNFKKALILASVSLGLLSVQALTADVAKAGYASGSASVTNIDGSTYSTGGEFSGKGVSYNKVTVAPSFASLGALSKQEVITIVNNLTIDYFAGNISLDQFKKAVQDISQGQNTPFQKVSSLNVSSDSVNANTTQTIDGQVVKTLNSLTSNGTSMPTANLSPYVSIIRAAGGSNGLE